MLWVQVVRDLSTGNRSRFCWVTVIVLKRGRDSTMGDEVGRRRLTRTAEYKPAIALFPLVPVRKGQFVTPIRVTEYPSTIVP